MVQILKQVLIEVKTVFVVGAVQANFLEREEEKSLLSFGATTRIDQDEVALFKR